MNSEITLLIGNPSSDGNSVNRSAQLFAFMNTRGRKTVHAEMIATVPQYCFNQLWATALNARDEFHITHFLLWHADVRPLGPEWLNVMFDEMDANGADVLSAIIPIKDEKGVTSTALSLGDWNATRLTQTQVLSDKFPDTWSADELLVNTGLMLVDFRKPWVEKICFTMRDKIVKVSGKWKASFEPEDWNFSRQCHKLGVRLFVTRKVVTEHWGLKIYRSDEVWGSENDPEAPALNPGFEVVEMD